jgi:hypothetical protein
LSFNVQWTPFDRRKYSTLPGLATLNPRSRVLPDGPRPRAATGVRGRCKPYSAGGKTSTSRNHGPPSKRCGRIVARPADGAPCQGRTISFTALSLPKCGDRGPWPMRDGGTASLGPPVLPSIRSGKQPSRMPGASNWYNKAGAVPVFLSARDVSRDIRLVDSWECAALAGAALLPEELRVAVSGHGAGLLHPMLLQIRSGRQI